MKNNKLDRSTTGLLVIDIQDRLFPYIERSSEMMHAVKIIVEGFKILNLPIFVSEQVPEKMGKTLLELRHIVQEEVYSYFSKTTFSCLGSEYFQKIINGGIIKQWILIGIETHVCVLQTARDLIRLNQDVVVLNDATSSRSIYDYSTAIAEIRDCGGRVSSVETVLFELLSDSSVPEFKQISRLIK